MYIFRVFFVGDRIEEDTNEPVEGDREDIRQESFSLPGGFVWDTLDLGNEEVVNIIFYRFQVVS